MATRYQVAIMCGLNCLSNTAINKKPVFVSTVVTFEKTEVAALSFYWPLVGLKPMTHELPVGKRLIVVLMLKD